MKTLEVSIKRVNNAGDRQGDPDSVLHSPTFPFLVQDSSGVVLADGVVGDRASERLQFEDPENNAFLYVKLVWPSGKTEVQQAVFGRATGASVQFVGSSFEVPDWARWASPRVASALDVSPERTSSGRSSILRFRNVWLRLWRFYEGQWSQLPIEASHQASMAQAKQVELRLEAGSHLLQLGSSSLPWFFVSLPTGGVCRVLLTPQRQAGPDDLPLRVVLTSARADAETLLEFLSQDEMGAARSVARFGRTAEVLLQRKFEDATSAIAGAYFLLRSGDWRSVPIDWFENLYGLFPWSADAALIRVVVAIRSGFELTTDLSRACQLVTEVLTRGLPMFAEAHRLMLEASIFFDAARRTPESEGGSAVTMKILSSGRLATALGTFSNLVAARADMGSAFAFYGAFPDRPSSVRQRGAAPDPSGWAAGFEEVPHELHLPAGLELGFTASGNRRQSRSRRTNKKTATFLKDL
jgi:hypothetical protein